MPPRKRHEQGASGERRLVILIVDDDAGVRTMLGHALKQFGHTPRLAGSGQEAIEILQNGSVDVGLLDLQMPGMDGMQAFQILRQIDPELACIFMTGYAAMYTKQELLAAGAYAVLDKPFRLEDLRQLLRKASHIEG
jgi:two-component system response regulator AtoC